MATIGPISVNVGTGAFEITDVPNGTYTLTATATGPGGTANASTSVTINALTIAGTNDLNLTVLGEALGGLVFASTTNLVGPGTILLLSSEGGFTLGSDTNLTLIPYAVTNVTHTLSSDGGLNLSGTRNLDAWYVVDVCQPASLSNGKYPYLETARETRIIDDVCDLLHNHTAQIRPKIQRWIQHVLSVAQRGRRFWFVEATACATLKRGQDIVDVVGTSGPDDIDRIIAAWCLERLEAVPLTSLLDWRVARHGSNAVFGPPTHYALEAGRRVHLWPAPHTAMHLHILYTRPLHIGIVPDEWEPVILDGILGLYGRHFDRDALTQDPEFFEQRFYRALRSMNIDSFDAMRLKAPDAITQPGRTAPRMLNHA